MELKRIDNIDVYCSDLSSMVVFYRDVLELPTFLPIVEGEGWAAFDAGNLTLYLFASPGEHAPRRTTPTEENPPALDSFAFEVDDLDQAVGWLDGRVEWADDGEETWSHGHASYRYRSFYDPDGNLLHITEPHLA